MPIPLGRAYGVFQAGLPLQLGDFFLESAQDNITATAGGSKAAAFQINSQTSRITTVASIGDSVQLPSATPGLELIVINHGANSMQVFGNAADSLDDQSPFLGVSQMANSMVIFTCVTAGSWYTEGLASGFAKNLGLQTFSYATISSNATNTQASGTPVTSMLVNVIGAAAGSVTLPPSQPGLELTVHNISAFIVNMFPSAGGTGTEVINSLVANAFLALPSNTSTVVTCTTLGQWYTVPRTPS